MLEEAADIIILACFLVLFSNLFVILVIACSPNICVNNEKRISCLACSVRSNVSL